MRPGRQAWEQAPDFFKQTAAVADELARVVRLGDLAPKVALAKRLKEQGNAVFGEVGCCLGHGGAAAHACMYVSATLCVSEFGLLHMSEGEENRLGSSRTQTYRGACNLH